jgi:DNA-binding protein Fis
VEKRLGMIDEREYKRMEFDPTVKKSLTAVYPKLKEIVGSGDDKMLRYVILMYDVSSPLRQHYPELGKRKEFAASIAGYDLMKDDVTSLFDFKLNDEPYEELIDMIMKYLKYQNNWVWTMIVSNEQAFFEYNKRVMMPVEGNRDKDILQAINIKTQIMTSQDEIYQRLQKYYRDLSGGDDSLQDAITIRKRLRPEEIANAQSNR